MRSDRCFYLTICPFLSIYCATQYIRGPVKQKEIDLDPTGQEITKMIPDFPLSCYYSEFTSDTYDLID